MKSFAQACDGHRLESYLRGELDADAEHDLTAHLDECLPCRDQLDQLAAEPAAWEEAESLLKPEAFDDEQASTPRTGQTVQIQHVLDAFAPTDDPRMLGRLGGLEVSGVVGAGAMGVVLKGYDKSLDRTVAIKVMAPHLASHGAARKRFAREAKAAAAVLHPNVMAIHSVSNDESLPYLVMPYVGGVSLQKRLDAEGPLPTSEILRIGAQIAAGLQAAHAQGLVHRDIKPANILLEKGVERVAITDFGLARAVDDATMTRSGVIAGTPQYMSPEQARGEAVDTRSDLFSLGSVLYALCTGHPPFRAETSYGVLRRITDTEPRPIREISPEIPDWLCEIIAKLMSKRPEDRFASAGVVADLLGAWLAHLQQPGVIPPPERTAKPAVSAGDGRKRSGFHRNLVGAAFAFLLLLAGVVIVLELNKGTLTIECEADDVPIKIVQGDRVVEKLTVSKAGRSVRVAAGQYVVEVDGTLDGITVEGGTVQLQRRGREVVKISERFADQNKVPDTADRFGLSRGAMTIESKANEKVTVSKTRTSTSTRKSSAKYHVEIRRGDKRGPETVEGTKDFEKENVPGAIGSSTDQITVDIYCGEDLLPQMNTSPSPVAGRHANVATLLFTLNAMQGVTTNFRTAGPGHEIAMVIVRDPSQQCRRESAQTGKPSEVRIAIDSAMKAAGIRNVRWEMQQQEPPDSAADWDAADRHVRALEKELDEIRVRVGRLWDDIPSCSPPATNQVTPSPAEELKSMETVP